MADAKDCARVFLALPQGKPASRPCAVPSARARPAQAIVAVPETIPFGSIRAEVSRAEVGGPIRVH